MSLVLAGNKPLQIRRKSARAARMAKVGLLAVDFYVEEGLRASANRERLVFRVSTPTQCYGI